MVHRDGHTSLLLADSQLQLPLPAEKLAVLSQEFIKLIFRGVAKDTGILGKGKAPSVRLRFHSTVKLHIGCMSWCDEYFFWKHAFK
jgi:hypothetical protein